MKINFHELYSQYNEHKTAINVAIQRVLDSSQFIMGEEVFQFENELAAFLDTNYLVSCGSGTDALLLALMVINIKQGDEVITTPFSFAAAAEVISLLGGRPVFADIQSDTYNIDPAKIEEKITEKTKAIIPVSLYGQSADMDEINNLAEEYGKRQKKKIYVIEDAAQSLGAEYNGKKSGTLSDFACFSFFPTKPLGCYGDGGAIVVQDENLTKKIRSLRMHGQENRYEHKYIGFNCRLDALQAAILRVKLQYFPEEIKKRHLIASQYNLFLKDKGFVLPKIKPNRTSVYAQYSIRHDSRSDVMEFLKSKNIPTVIHYPTPLHLQPCFKYLNYQVGDFPIAEKISRQIFSLPMSAFLSPLEQSHIVKSLIEYTEVEMVT